MRHVFALLCKCSVERYCVRDKVQNAEDYFRKCFPTEKSETVGQCADLCFNLFLQDSVLCNMSKPDRTTRASQHSLLKVASSETRDAEPAL